MSDYIRSREDHVDHTPSWLSVRELVEYDWDQVTERQGVVGADQYLEFKKNGKPSSWSGDVSGRGVNKVSTSLLGRGYGCC